MSKLRNKFAGLNAKTRKAERESRRSLKKVADTAALQKVGDQKLGYAIKDTIKNEACYYGTIVEYASAKGKDIKELARLKNKAGGELELYNLAIDIYLTPEYEFAHDTFDLLVEQGYELGQYDNDAKEFIENKARHLDSIANTDDVVKAIEEAIETANHLAGEGNIQP